MLLTEHKTMVLNTRSLTLTAVIDTQNTRVIISQHTKQPRNATKKVKRLKVNTVTDNWKKIGKTSDTGMPPAVRTLDSVKRWSSWDRHGESADHFYDNLNYINGNRYFTDDQSTDEWPLDSSCTLQCPAGPSSPTSMQNHHPYPIMSMDYQTSDSETARYPPDRPFAMYTRGMMSDDPTRFVMQMLDSFNLCISFQPSSRPVLCYHSSLSRISIAVAQKSLTDSPLLE
ncbi:hypothetical protein ACTXT7_009640 [Hymenolepis weldensis]